MRLRGVRGSRHVEDRRGRRGGGMAIGGRGLGIGGVLLLLVIGAFTGIDVTPFLTEQPGPRQSAPKELTAEERQAGEFVSRVLATTEEV